MRKICTLELLSPKKALSFCSIREDEIFPLINACKASFGARCKDQDALIHLIKEVVSLAGGFDVEELFPSIKFLHLIGGMKPKLEKLHQNLD
ncbi:hypothetical protein LguiB_034268 [Lonicera macranthoides]